MGLEVVMRYPLVVAKKGNWCASSPPGGTPTAAFITSYDIFTKNTHEDCPDDDYTICVGANMAGATGVPDTVFLNCMDMT